MFHPSFTILWTFLLKHCRKKLLSWYLSSLKRNKIWQVISISWKWFLSCFSLSITNIARCSASWLFSFQHFINVSKQLSLFLLTITIAQEISIIWGRRPMLRYTILTMRHERTWSEDTFENLQLWFVRRANENLWIIAYWKFLFTLKLVFTLNSISILNCSFKTLKHFVISKILC